MSSSSVTNNSTSFEVQLAVYDLSQGTARLLSAQFLGPDHALEIIPHTALVVYGREYFFGGGIQHEDPTQFRQMMGMYPIQTLSLGRTHVSRQNFEQWCYNCTRTGRYTAASYDLLHRNCNNFSHDAAKEGLQLSQGVPEWILEVPRRFLSSPMGQLVRPMLENMQVVAGSGGGAHSISAPFANAPTSNFATAAAPVASTTNSQKADKEMPTPKEMSSPSAQGTPLLDSFCKPLVSCEYKTVGLCVKKINGCLDDDNDAADKEALQTIGQTLSTAPHKLDSAQVEQACQIIHSKVLLPQKTKSAALTFALMLLRVIILQSATTTEDSVQKCLEWIETQLTTTEALSGHAARSMAWLTLANAASLSSWWTTKSSTIIEAALGDWTIDSQPRQEVRQAAAAFCYNQVLVAAASPDDNEELSDDRVSLLCSSLDGIGDEPDVTTRLRRLLVAARIVLPKEWVVISAKTLLQELGFVDAIQELQTSTTATGNKDDAKKCQTLAKELLGVLQG